MRLIIAACNQYYRIDQTSYLIIISKQLYMWGSTTNGKCGFGPIVNTQECYASVPTRVIVGPEDRRIKKYVILFFLFF